MTAAFSRQWAMPSPDTFSVEPIGALVRRYLAGSKASIDPFARNNCWASATNDLNPDTAAEYHLDAEEFCHEMVRQQRLFDLAIFDPPYSPRQISECYKGMGLAVGTKETQNAALYKRVRDAMVPILSPDAIVLSFGWNSSGMGQRRGFSIIEIMLVAHGGAHNDTICLAERREPQSQSDFFLGATWSRKPLSFSLASRGRPPETPYCRIVVMPGDEGEE